MFRRIGESLKTYSGIARESKRSEQKLDDILPYIGFIDNRYDIPIILLKDGTVVTLFEISGIDYEQLSQEEKNSLSEVVKVAFLQLEEGFSLTNYFDRDKIDLFPLERSGDSPEIIKYIQGKKEDYWKRLASGCYNGRIYCSLAYNGARGKKIPLSSMFFERQLFSFSEKEIDQKVDLLYQGLLSVKSAFKKFGFFMLNKNESFAALYKMINFSPVPGFRDSIDLNSQLAHNSLIFEDDMFRSGNGSFCRIISVKYLPEHSFPLYFERLYELKTRFIIKQSFRVVGFSKIEKNIKSNQNIARSVATVDKSSEHYVNEVDDFLSDVKIHRENLIRWNLSILIIEESEESLNEKSAELITILKEIGSFGMAERFNLKYSYFSMLPGNDRLNARTSLIMSGNAADFFSAYLLFRGDRKPVDYFRDRNSGIFSYDPFTGRENAWHMAITGPTGGGKSFMVNKILLSGLAKNPRIYVIDLSGSFSEFFDFLKEEMPEETSILKVSGEEINFSFNPFLIDDLNKDVTDKKIKFCEGLLKIMIGKNLINEGNRIVLTDTLKQFFLQFRSILRNMSDRVSPPPLDILIPILEQKSDSKAIPDALRYWQEGRRGAMFNSGKDTVMQAKYIYFDIRDMEGSEEEMEAIVYTIFNKIYNDIGQDENAGSYKILIMDEAHRYLKNSEFSFWIDLLIRTGRHFKLLVGIVTQSINDLICDDAWSTGVINNLKQAFFFSGQKNIENSFAKLQMNESVVELYNSMRDSEREFLYWSSKGIRRVLSPKTDPYTYWLATTHPDERILRKKVKEELCGGDTKKTIEVCVTETLDCTDTTERVEKLNSLLSGDN